MTRCRGFWKCVGAGAEVVGGLAVMVLSGPVPNPGHLIGAAMMTHGVIGLGGDVHVGGETVVADDGGSRSGTSSSGSAGGLPIGNTGIRIVGPAEILAVDTYALLIGQASHFYTFPMDLEKVWDQLSQGNLGAAGTGVVFSALNLAIPRYGNAGGRGWGLDENMQTRAWEHTLGPRFNFALNRTDQGSFDHDQHDIDWRWIRDQWSIGGSGRASGPFALGYKMIGTAGFALSGFRN